MEALTTVKRPVDDENSNSPKKAKVKNSHNEENEFYRLFVDILHIFTETRKMDENEIGDGICQIIKSFNWKENNKFSDVDLNQSDILGGYLYRYGPHGAGLARTRIMDAISNCEDMKSKLKKPELNIISLGGGPGNDIVGLCSALYDFEFCSVPSALTCPKKLNITVTDSIQRFASCVNLLEFFIREGNYGNVSQLFKESSVYMSFLRLELPDKSTKCVQTLKEADIIVMSKLFSILDETVKEGITEYLHQNMKQHALLLYIDSPFFPSLWENFNILYKSESEYYSKSDITEMFGHNDNVTSKAQIVVLRKK